MNKLFIYEIGAITHHYKNNQIVKALNWRIKLDDWAADNNILTFNPALTYLEETNHTYNPNIVVAQNDFYIDKCNIAVVNLDDIDFSPGSIYELIRFKELRKPVIAFGNEKHWSPHINSCISHQCNNLDEVIELLCNMFNQS